MGRGGCVESSGRLGLAFWAADVVWRGVDEKSVRLAGWAYKKVTRES